MGVKFNLDEALDLAERDPEAFVKKARETARQVDGMLGAAGEKIDALYQKSQKPGAVKKAVRNAAIRAAAREIKRHRG